MWVKKGYVDYKGFIATENDAKWWEEFDRLTEIKEKEWREREGSDDIILSDEEREAIFHCIEQIEDRDLKNELIYQLTNELPFGGLGIEREDDNDDDGCVCLPFEENEDRSKFVVNEFRPFEIRPLNENNKRVMKRLEKMLERMKAEADGDEDYLSTLMYEDSEEINEELNKIIGPKFRDYIGACMFPYL